MTAESSPVKADQSNNVQSNVSVYLFRVLFRLLDVNICNHDIRIGISLACTLYLTNTEISPAYTICLYLMLMRGGRKLAGC